MKTKHFIINRAFILMTALMTANIGCAQTAERLPESNLTIADEYSDEELSALARYLDASYCPHELSIWTAGGMSFLNSRPAFGKTNAGFGGALGVGYTCFLNKNWGLSSGVEYAFYQAKTTIDGFSGNQEIFDVIGNPIVYQTQIQHYSEKQKLGSLNIPLSMLYQTGNKQQFYVSLGVKLGLPVSAKYNGSNAVLTASGYYPDYDQTEIWQNDLGYGIFNVKESSGKLDLGVSFLGTMEIGMKWNVGTGTALYTGVFVDYGLNNALNNHCSDMRFVEYNRNAPEKPLMNTTCVLSDKFSPLNFGVKLKLAFSVGCRDLLKDRKTYRAMRLKGNDFYDFDMQNQTPETAQPTPAVVPADIIETEMPKETKQPDTAVLNAEAERLAYLEKAKERRQKYSKSMSVLSIRSMGNYNRGIVTLTVEQEAALDDYIDVLTENPSFVLEITGHTCDLGTDELNLRIGQERADLAKDYLVEKGISPSCISTFSKGKSEPLFPNDNEVNRKKNRRLEIVIKK
jgi:outer membrane protein OmpA-like peptidoglycan-associated protein